MSAFRLGFIRSVLLVAVFLGSGACHAQCGSSFSSPPEQTI